MTPEGKVKKACRDWLRSAGAYVYSPVPMGYGPPSVDDYICLSGMFIAIEYKRGDKPVTPTKRQERTLAEVRNAGGLAFVVQSVDELRAIFRDAGLYFD